MNLFDFLLWAFMGVSAFRISCLKKELDKMIGWLMFGILILLLQMIYEGFKWQSVFLYLMPVFWLMYYKWQSKKLISIVLVVGFIISSALLVIFPTPVLNEPTGEYVVGTTRMSVIDETREMYNEPREIPIQVWYPSLSSEGENPVNWMVDGKEAIRAFADDYGVLPFMFDQLEGVKTHSYEDIKVASGKFPVVVISHGWDSSRHLHINFAEMLASNGYVVIGIDHTYGAAMTKLHDGRIIQRDKSLLGDDFIADGNALITMYKDDIEFVCSKLEKLDDKHVILKGHINTEKVGLLGHSTGAGASVMYALDHEVDALVALDAWVEPFEINKTLDVPNIFFRSEAWSEYPNNENLSLVTDKVYEMIGSGHHDFTVGHKLSPLLEVIGYLTDDYEVMQEAYVLAFYNHYLKGQPLDLETITKKYEKLIKHVNTLN